MKKSLLVVLALLAGSVAAFAQENGGSVSFSRSGENSVSFSQSSENSVASAQKNGGDVDIEVDGDGEVNVTRLAKRIKRHYIRLGYASQGIEPEFGTNLRSNAGGAIEFGSTFVFNNRRPLAGMVRFGLDFSYLDIQAATFKVGNYGYGDDEEGGSMDDRALMANIGMQIGPSITVTPIDRLHARVYVHYAPSATAITPHGGFDDVMAGYTGYVTGGLEVSYRFITLGIEARNGSSDMSWIVGGDDDDEDEGAGKIPVRLLSNRFMLGFRF
ncbi:MAG: hypothetical protein LBV38_01935 [Alistipes sp.]|jgi:hypothetical protein|nr:hypothetical protein [Alistipes sp.]